MFLNLLTCPTMSRAAVSHFQGETHPPLYSKIESLLMSRSYIFPKSWPSIADPRASCQHRQHRHRSQARHRTSQTCPRQSSVGCCWVASGHCLLCCKLTYDEIDIRDPICSRVACLFHSVACHHTLTICTFVHLS